MEAIRKADAKYAAAGKPELIGEPFGFIGKSSIPARFQLP
jgi:hypothetical protein